MPGTKPAPGAGRGPGCRAAPGGGGGHRAGPAARFPAGGCGGERGRVPATWIRRVGAEPPGPGRAERRCGAGEMQAAPWTRSLVLLSLLLAVPGRAAPKDGISRSEDPAAGLEPVPNLLHPKPEELRRQRRASPVPRAKRCHGYRLAPSRLTPARCRLLQGYLRSVGQPAQDPAHMTREQVLLYLCALHDYDRSGQLDGLEFMQLLTGLVAQQAQGQPSPDAVIVAVDGILATQDLNQDGLLNPSELLLPAQAPAGDGVVQWAPQEPEPPAAALETPSPQGAAAAGVEPPEAVEPVSEQPAATGPSQSPPGPEAAQPTEDAAGEAPGGPNSEI
ncbi:cell growth regulator with EF hand domain protein 1 isoform X1 [Pelodiscus sinensis]|uniref:cell growth regulator with EF hand domain protein 1 isoform X1 n=1 Tax=Pelodiscus sinensis TaxID=13735 RepID=UPI003F6D6280